jgi:hypothetical protein
MDKQTEDKILTMLPLLNERQKRIYLATEAVALGRGGIKELSKLTGVSQTTIIKGKKEIYSGEPLDIADIRNSGGGRKKNRNNPIRDNGDP